MMPADSSGIITRIMTYPILRYRRPKLSTNRMSDPPGGSTSTPIEIGLPRRSAPSVGLRRRKDRPFGRRRPPQAEFIRHARPTDGRRPLTLTPIEISLPRRLRAGRRPSPTQRPSLRSAQADHRPKAFSRRLKSASPGAPRQASASADARTSSRSAQADHRLKASPGRIHSAPRPTTSRRPSTPMEISLPRHSAPGVGLRRRKNVFPVGAGRPPAEGPLRPNSFGTQADHQPKAFHADGNQPPQALRARPRPPPTQERLPGRRRPTTG